MTQPVELISTPGDLVGLASAVMDLTAAAIEIRAHEDTHQVILPPGWKREDITTQVAAQKDAPARKRGSVELHDVASFVLYCEDQGAKESGYLYAIAEKHCIVAVFNDHQAGPGWQDHRATLALTKTREAEIWLKHNTVPMEQEAFATFLEDNIADVVEPSGEVLLKVALTLQAKTDVSFRSARRLDNGQVQLQYSETIDARAGDGDLVIPREFSIGIRLFKNVPGYKLRARLKYRLAASKVRFWYELDRPLDAIEEAFKGIADEVQEKSGYPMLFGLPPSVK